MLLTFETTITARLSYTRQRRNSRTIVAFAYNLSSMLLTIDIPVSHTTNPRSNTDSPLSASLRVSRSLCGLDALRFKCTVGKRSTDCRILILLSQRSHVSLLFLSLFSIYHRCEASVIPICAVLVKRNTLCSSPRSQQRYTNSRLLAARSPPSPRIHGYCRM